MASCWSSVLAVLGGHAASQPPDDEQEAEGKKAMLHRRLLDGWAEAASEKEEVKNLTAEVRALERALAEASTAREAAEAKRREAEAALRVATERHEAQVEELRRALDAQDDRDARIQELEERIRELNNANSKWRFF